MLILSACITIVSCNKKFDEPPVYVPPVITPDLTIADLKAMHVSGQFEQITEDKTIGGVVIADDRSGQFYKTIVIQDETGGISVRLDAYDLYTSYPIGRMVYIKVKGLYLGDYNKLIQLGGGIDNSGTSPRLDEIPSVLIDNYIIKGSLDNVITPKVVSVDELNDDYQNMLIQLDDYQFAAEDTAETFAKPDLSSSAVNFTLEGCSGGSIILRNSSYADFAGYNVPNGNGSIIAVYTVFGTTKQLNIRDSSDVQFYGDRCNGSGSGGTSSGIFTEDFSSVTNNVNIALTGWQNVAESGSKLYTGAVFSSVKCAKMTAYNSGQSTVKTWLITPAINLTGYTTKSLSFKNTDGYDNGATLKAYISTNYTGNATPWTATWTQLPATISSGHGSGYGSFISSGDISLNAYTGNVYIAFVYEGADPSGGTKQTTTFEIDDVVVSAE